MQALFSFFIFSSVLCASPELFRDDFSRYPAGPCGNPCWRPLGGDWRLVEGKLRQLAEDDLLALIADFSPPPRFRLETRFRTVAGLSGEGLLFNIREAVQRKERAASAQIVRVDPEGLYYGYLDASGEFHGDGPVPALVEGQVWNELAVDADRDSGRWSIDWNGKSVARGLPLQYRSGPIGLVAGRGVSEFALCSVRGEAAGAEAPPAQGGEAAPAIDLALSPAGDLVLLARSGPAIRIENRDRKVLASFGEPADKRHPTAIALGPKGEVYVLDSEPGSIDRYPAEGGPPGGDPAKIPPAAPPRVLKTDPPLENPRDLAVFPDGRIAVAESRSSQIAILGPDGARLLAVGKKGNGNQGNGLERPSGVAIDSAGRIIASDMKACRMFAYAPDGKGGYVPAEKSTWMAPPNAIAIGPGDSIVVLGRFAYYETGGALRFLDKTLYPRGFLAGFAIGDFAEEGGIAVDPRSGTIFYLSKKDGRIFQIPAGLSGPADVAPRTEYKGGNVVVTWTSLSDPAAGPKLQHRPAGGKGGDWADVPATASGRTFSAAIPGAGLDPTAPREYRFLPQFLARPDLGWSKPYRFYPPEPPGKRRYLDLSIACAVYTKFEEAGGNGRFEMKPEQVGAKVRAEFEKAREFYFRNSRLRLNVRADIYVVVDPPASVRGGWLDPAQVKKDLKPLIERQGKKLEDYDSTIGTWAEDGYRADLPDDPGIVGGGGLTSFAYTSFGMGGALAWLFCHEYHHQIDAFFNSSGHLNYPLNHPDASVQPGRYGQHWDCNAFFLRSWGDLDWFFCNYGKVLFTDDRDGDGVPDGDPALPFDEARLGSDPSKADTDGDGLGDFAEATCGTFRGSDPKRPDTDGDGLPDGSDPRPLHRASPDLIQGTPKLDGQIGAGEWQDLGEIPEPGLRLGARWDAENLYVSASAKRPVVLAVEADGANDGWFLEADNAAVEFLLDGGPSPSIQGAKGARGAGSGGQGAPQAEVAIPWSAMKIGPRKAGERFGLLFRASYKDGERRRELFLFEPWELFELTLK